MSDSLTSLNLAQAREGLAKGDFTSVELTESYIKAVEKARPLNAYVTETPEQAMEMAKASDARRASGQVGVLEGLPVGIKELFCTKGVQSSACSKILHGFKPTYESTVTQNMFDDGAVMLGKLNMDEFAMGSANVTSADGNVLSPWTGENPAEAERKIVPGGSSGGSSAAVSSHACIAATGTDTGGSIRQPASFTGIVGLKPTYGRCSRWGIIAFASSLDQAGPMTRTVQDSAIMLQSMAGYDAKDSTSIDIEVPDYEKAITGDIRGLKVGIPKEYRVDNMPEEIAKIWDQGIEWLKDAGAEIVDVSLPHTKYALPTYYIVAPAECSSNLARYDGVRYCNRVDGEGLNGMYENTRAAGFGEEVRRRILIGTYVLSAGYYDAYYLKAQKVRTCIANDFKKAYENCDVLLTPTAPSTAFAIGENSEDPLQMYLNDIFTVPASLAGMPGISVPAGLGQDGLPLGLQLLGRPFDEGTLLNVASVVEKASGFNAKPPFMAG